MYRVVWMTLLLYVCLLMLNWRVPYLCICIICSVCVFHCKCNKALPSLIFFILNSHFLFLLFFSIKRSRFQQCLPSRAFSHTRCSFLWHFCDIFFSGISQSLCTFYWAIFIRADVRMKRLCMFPIFFTSMCTCLSACACTHKRVWVDSIVSLLREKVKLSLAHFVRACVHMFSKERLW